MRRHSDAAMHDEVYAYFAERDAEAGGAAMDAWTPQAVMVRMEEAFRILRVLPGAVGPKSFGSNWPSFVQEVDPDDLRQMGAMRGLIEIAMENNWTNDDMPDYMEAGVTYLAERDATSRRKAERESDQPTKYDISRMEEALHWPSRFLADYAIGADALNTWALCKAAGVKIEHKLRLRASRAKLLAEYIQWQVNEKKSAARRQYAMDAAQWAQMRYRLSPKTRDAVDRIMANARIRRDRDIAKSGAASLVFISPAEVYPHKVISRTALDRHRLAAATRISQALEAL